MDSPLFLCKFYDICVRTLRTMIITSVQQTKMTKDVEVMFIYDIVD